MLTALSLPALAILVSLPGLSGFPGLSHLGFRRAHQPTATDRLAPARQTVAPLAPENHARVVEGAVPRRAGEPVRHGRPAAPAWRGLRTGTRAAARSAHPPRVARSGF